MDQHDMLAKQEIDNVSPSLTETPVNPPVIESAPRLEQKGEPRKMLLSRIIARDIPRPPFAGKKLERADIEQLLLTHQPNQLDLRGADLREADLNHINLAGARFGDDDPLASDRERRDLAARLDRARLAGAHLEGIIAPAVVFEGADLRATTLTDANLEGASFENAYMADARLNRAQLTGTNFADATLTDAILDDAVAVGAQFVRARLHGAHLAGTDLGLANMVEADLRYAVCSEQTHCGGTFLNKAFLDGLRYRDIDLTPIDWAAVRYLGEEEEAQNALPNAQILAYRVAARTYRRLALALRAQGLNPEGDHYAARARLMERKSMRALQRENWRGRRVGPTIVYALRWLNSFIQGMVTGYGEHPARAIIWAAGIALVIAPFYTLILPSHPDLLMALLLSVSSLLGHGYASLPELFTSDYLMPLISIFESIIGTVLILLFTLALARKTLN
jgi:uncharacterized protein YjbI with pentapeptide repeats